VVVVVRVVEVTGAISTGAAATIAGDVTTVVAYGAPGAV
jgi:hypothetical protein